MDYYSLITELDFGILGLQESDIEYQIVNGKPELIGVWLYSFCSLNHACDVSDYLTDAASNAIYGLMLADMAKPREVVE